ncbi:MAG: class A beta-lactamase [Pseudomonadota bacterium]
MKTTEIWSRRTILSGLAACSMLPACVHVRSTNPEFSLLEGDYEGRLGIAAMDLTSGRTLAHRADERFAFCSSFKWLLGALILARVDADEEDLGRLLRIAPDDLVFYSPVTEPRLGESMSIGELCKATITTSDNTAANLLITELGGPSGFTAALRSFGDAVTRLDRYETELNENAPGDPRDTTTPNAMLGLMRQFLFGEALSVPSQTLLRQWMIDARTGRQRLRAGLPQDWIAGDKTGTSINDQSNDVAFAIPPTGAEIGPVLIVSFANVPNPLEQATNAVHASVARAVMEGFGI